MRMIEPLVIILRIVAFNSNVQNLCLYNLYFFKQNFFNAMYCNFKFRKILSLD